MHGLSKHPIVLILAAAALVAVAATPTLQLSPNDGKARAVASGEIDVEAMQEAAVADGIANADAASIPVGGADCTNGFAGPYPCENVDLESIVHLAELGGATGADVWGWTDGKTGREIAISSMTYGMAFVDVTDPTAPQVLGRVYVGWEGEDDDVLWRDVKVYESHAYLVSEHDATNLVIFDLTRLRGVHSDQGEFEPDAVFDGFGSAHNIAINTETGYAYVVGGDVCAGGLYMLDLSEPTAPTEAGCFDGDGYTHDVQCVVYDGPDAEHRGDEICFASNEDTLTIVDVTDKANPVQLSRTGYPSAAYTHQGWLTDDHGTFVFGDELDELLGTVSATTTYIADVSDLDAPATITPFTHETTSIDHNIYVHKGLIFEANYSAGLRVMDFTDESLADGELTQVAFFDVDPGPEAPAFAGAWTAYPFFRSGTIVLNSFDSGLFVLTLDESLLPPHGKGKGNGGPPQDRGNRPNDGGRPADR
ncbi:MAG: choice-of-anchor B family protein [Nitriliruptorales bacterium]|nr:choice-of-anchor B family protein [Nitriliruptorales bacterium]